MEATEISCTKPAVRLISGAITLILSSTDEAVSNDSREATFISLAASWLRSAN